MNLSNSIISIINGDDPEARLLEFKKYQDATAALSVEEQQAYEVFHTMMRSLHETFSPIIGYSAVSRASMIRSAYYNYKAGIGWLQESYWPKHPEYPMSLKCRLEATNNHFIALGLFDSFSYPLDKMFAAAKVSITNAMKVLKELQANEQAKERNEQ